MTSGPTTSWQIDGETKETVRDFILGGSKIIAGSDCSHEIKRHLLLGRKAMTNLDNVLKNRHHFANKGPYTQSYGFSSSHVCTIKKVEHQRTWTARRSNQSIPKEINLEIGLNIRRTDAEVKVPILGHLMQRANSLEKFLMLGKMESKGKWGGRRWDD